MKKTEIVPAEKMFELTNKVLLGKWNSTSKTHTATTILNHLGPKKDGVQSLVKMIEERKAKMDKYAFQTYYGTTLEDLQALIKAVEDTRNENTIQSTDLIVGEFLYSGIRNSIVFSELRWENYDFLKKEKLSSIFGHFDTYFRGDVVQIHRIKNEAYLIVETKKHPYDYDKQRTKWKEPTETAFYFFTKDENGKFQNNSYSFSTFEDALFHAVCPSYAGAMSALYKQSLNEK